MKLTRHAANRQAADSHPEVIFDVRFDAAQVTTELGSIFITVADARGGDGEGGCTATIRLDMTELTDLIAAVAEARSKQLRDQMGKIDVLENQMRRLLAELGEES